MTLLSYSTQSLLPILSCTASTKLEGSLFLNRPQVARTAMKMAGTSLGRAMYHDVMSAHVAGRRRHGGGGNNSNNNNNTLNPHVIPERVNLILLLGKGNNTGDALYAASSFLAEAPPTELSAPTVNLLHCFDTAVTTFRDGGGNNSTNTNSNGWDAGVTEAYQCLLHTAQRQRENWIACFGQRVDLEHTPTMYQAEEEEEGAAGISDNNTVNNQKSFVIREWQLHDKSEDAIARTWARVSEPVVGEAICVLDGVFGMQFKPPLRGVSKTLMALVNNAANNVRVRCAVDVPSGVGDKCDWENGPFRADYTYATGILKEPLVVASGGGGGTNQQEEERARSIRLLNVVGRIRLVDLGFFNPQCIFARPAALSASSSSSSMMQEFIEDHKNHPVPSQEEGGTPAAAAAGAANKNSSKTARSMWVVSPETCFPIPPRPVHSDKRSFGHLVIVAGSQGMPGAAVMATKAAIRSGVGLVTVCAPQRVCDAGSIAVPEAMWVCLPTLDAAEEDVRAQSKMTRELSLPRVLELLSTGKYDSMLIGPGMGRARETQQVVQDLVAFSSSSSTIHTVVLDADALHPAVMQTIATAQQRQQSSSSSSSSCSSSASFLGPAKNKRCNVVLTPHAGELARCAAPFVDGRDSSDHDHEDIVANVLSRALHGAIIVEKGSRTWVRRSDFFGGDSDVGVVDKNNNNNEKCHHNHSSVAVLIPAGGPVLARGGSGDVLAGTIAGACAAVRREARSLCSGHAAAAAAASEPELSSLVFDSVVRSTLRHGLAADAVARASGEEHSCTTDIISAL